MKIIESVETPKAPATRAGKWILVDKGDGSFQPFVTAWLGYDEETGKPDQSWIWGHYFEHKNDAIRSFDLRARGIKVARCTGYVPDPKLRGYVEPTYQQKI